MRRSLPFALSALLTATLAGCLRSSEPLDLEGDELGLDPALDAPVEIARTQTEASVAPSQDPAPSIDEAEPPRAEERASTRDSDFGYAGLPAAEAGGGAANEGLVAGVATGRATREPADRAVRGRPAPTPTATPLPAAAPRGYAGEASTAAGDIPHRFAPPPPPEPDLPLTPGSERYTEYGVNDFVDPRRDPLSTFAIDVDTASYAVTRRKLTEGYLPPGAAVRVEEFVNYFPYEYRQPAAGDPFAVDFEAAPSPFNPRNHIVRVGVQGRTIAHADRRPVHLTFLVDVSGSMRSADKLDLVKRSLTMLTEELDDGDTVAIATYAGATRVVLEPTPIRERDRILASLDGLTAGGSTAMSSGIELAYRLADQTFVPGDVNRVIVASDGDANVGATSHTEISRQIRAYADRGVTLTTLGFGNGNYQDTMMERLANDGDGNYFYIDSTTEARRVLVERMTSTLEVIAKDVKIQVEFNPAQVLAYRLIGYENRDVADRDFRNDAVDAGEIGAGHQVTALYEVALADHARGSLATVRVRNKAPGPDSPAVERVFDLDAKAVRDSFTEASAQTRLAVAASAFAEVLRGSPHLSEVSLREVMEIAADAARPEYREDRELVELIDRASKLRGEGAFVNR